MAALTKKTIQALAMLRAISEWPAGALGSARIHEMLFLADSANDPEWRLFDFRHWWLGEYSDTISEVMNDLRAAGRIETVYDGPSERIRARLRPKTRARLKRFFGTYFPEWTAALRAAFRRWGQLPTDDMLRQSHDESAGAACASVAVVLAGGIAPLVEFEGLSDDDAEHLTDLVDARLRAHLQRALSKARSTPVEDEDWRRIYFGAVEEAWHPSARRSSAKT